MEWNTKTREQPNTHKWGETLQTVNNQIPTNEGRHFKPQVNNQTHTGGGGDTSSPKTSILMIQPKLLISQGGRHFKPPHLETDNPVETLNRSTQQTLAEKDEILKQLQKTQANISLWGLLMASYKHQQNLVDLLNQI